MNTIHIYRESDGNLSCSYDTPRESNIMTTTVDDEILESIKSGTVDEVRLLLTYLINS